MFIHISQLGEPLVIGCTENQSGVGKVTHRFKHWINVAIVCVTCIVTMHLILVKGLCVFLLEEMIVMLPQECMDFGFALA